MLAAGDAEVTIDAVQGGRLASLRVAGHELLVTDADRGPMLWGCYPMVPWAGRVRDGRFTFRGEAHQLPLDAPPHAIHGVGYRNAWTAIGPAALGLDLDWPLGGTATQAFALTPDALTLTMTVTAGDRAMPVVAGWHPCFRPDLRLAVDPVELWERDATGIPTGRLVPTADGPWDDAMHLRADPRLVGPDVAPDPQVGLPGVGGVRRGPEPRVRGAADRCPRRLQPGPAGAGAR